MAYLTTQVRQNTKSINSNNSNNVMTAFNHINVALLSDPEVARLSAEGFYGIDQFSEIDGTRFTHLMNGFFNIFRNLYHQYQDGTYPEDQWRIWALEAKQMMSTPGVTYFRQRTQT